MSYIFIAIGCFIIWWIINGIIVLKIRRPHILNIVNKENWLKEKTREMYKKIGEIEKTEEITWRKLSKNEETYNEMLYNQRYNWAAEVLKTYGVTIRDVPKMIGKKNEPSFITMEGNIENFIVTTLGAIKLYWNFIGIAELGCRLNVYLMHRTEQKELLLKVENEEYEVLEILKVESSKIKEETENKFDHTKEERVAREDCPF